MSYFTYNGRSSADFGLHIEKKDVFSAPEYDAEFISIPGRSGDIINPNRRFTNIKVTYTVFLARKNTASLASVLRDIKGWLYSEPDRYHVLRAYATSKEVTEVSDRITTIEEQKMLRLVIISSNGNIFKNGNVKTLLSAKVYSWDEDITDTLDANQFVWTRVSEDTEADKVWNEQHFGGAKSVVITGADVKVRATFYCDLIDTTTRQSLL